MQELADMTHIVCFSGGESSAIVAIEVVRKFGKENVVLLNHDISSKVEDADVKRFKKEISNYLGLPITYANHADFERNTPIQVCLDAKTWINPKTRTIHHGLRNPRVGRQNGHFAENK